MDIIYSLIDYQFINKNNNSINNQYEDKIYFGILDCQFMCPVPCQTT